MASPNQRYFDLAANSNVKNMLDMIAAAEGTSQHGYNTAFGGGKFDDLSDHPRVKRPFTQTDGKQNLSSAAGRYQFIQPTWDDLQSKFGFQDFGPQSQDAAATYLIERAGALDDVINGDYKTAVSKLGGVWASLPSSKYPQPKKDAGAMEQIINAVVPAAQAATTPPNQAPPAQEPAQAKEPLLKQTKQKIAGEPMPNTQDPQGAQRLIKTIAKMQGGQTDGNISPEAVRSLQGMREVRARMLPVTMGALMSGNAGANRFGQQMAPEAMAAFGPTKIGTSIVTPDGQVIKGGNSSRPDYFTPVQTSEGIKIINTSDGTVTPLQGEGGKPLMPPQYDPENKRQLAEAGEIGSGTGKNTIKTIIDAPKLANDAEYTISLVDSLINHPGLHKATGFPRVFGIQHIPGTDAKDFDIALNQINGQQFLAAFESLKGGGPITDIEGLKATQAISRMEAAGSTQEFLKAANEFREIMIKALNESKAVMNGGQSQQPNVANPQVSNSPDSAPASGSSSGFRGASPDVVNAEIQRRGLK